MRFCFWIGKARRRRRSLGENNKRIHLLYEKKPKRDARGAVW